MAALPDGRGARLAVVVDDVGGADTYLDAYLHLDIPLAFAVMPYTQRARADDAKASAAGRAVLLHIPLPIAGDLRPDGGIAIDATQAEVDRYLQGAVDNVPDAIGANNHQGSLGTSTPPLMQTLLPALRARHLWFLDSVTSQTTVAYAVAQQLGMASRINNVFLDNDASDATARTQLLTLARLGAQTGSAIGICHADRPWQLHALEQLAPQLRQRGYTFASVANVTNTSVGPLDAGVRTHL